ncbi:MAG: YabN family protein [Limisphaerales bacterium]
MPKAPSRRLSPVRQVLDIMAALRAPDGCPWDREQDHRTLRFHAVEEVYELLDAIEAGDDHELAEELGDLLLQVVFHCQLGRERGAFDLDAVCQRLADKLVRRHPHVFGDAKVKDVDQVWANWERIKRAEKHGTKHERPSALDGIPRHLPALLRAEKLVKKARKAGLLLPQSVTLREGRTLRAAGRSETASVLFDLAAHCQERGWSAEELLRDEVKRREAALRRAEHRALRDAPVANRRHSGIGRVKPRQRGR